MASTAPAPLRQQLFVALVVPAALAMAALAVMADYVARTALESALGDRLCAVAQAASTSVSPRVALLERGDDESRIAKRTRIALRDLAEATGVERIFLAGQSEARLLIDSDSTHAIGDEYTRARFDGPELEAVAAGAAAASVLFRGPDGRPYKTGYAPFKDRDGAVVGFVGVVAPASYADAIDGLRARMAGVAVLGLLILLGAAVVSARRVAVPLSSLSEAAARVGAGELDTEIPHGGPREAEVLGDAMRTMTTSLKAREEEMQMMLAGIAHEVRNPLGGIELFGGLLKEDLEGDKRQKHVLKILRELGTLARVVNDFLDFARKREPEPRTVALFDLGFEVVSLVEKQAGDRTVKVELEIPKDLSLHADPEGLKRAVLNLTRNAIQAAPEGGRVRLAATAQGGEVALSIEDDGEGVPEDKREEIFAPFFTTKQKGTGLGLALVRKTADEHGGRVTVDTSDLGGARFVLSLPDRGS